MLVTPPRDVRRKAGILWRAYKNRPQNKQDFKVLLREARKQGREVVAVIKKKIQQARGDLALAQGKGKELLGKFRGKILGTSERQRAIQAIKEGVVMGAYPAEKKRRREERLKQRGRVVPNWNDDPRRGTKPDGTYWPKLEPKHPLLEEEEKRR